MNAIRDTLDRMRYVCQELGWPRGRPILIRRKPDGALVFRMIGNYVFRHADNDN
jgi:hypothetical protein